MQLRPYQQEAVDAVYNYLREHDDNPCIVLPTGCHAKGHPILMYDGSVKKVEDVVVGDLIMGADSTPRRVLRLARGREPMAEIRPVKGEPFLVNENHILSLVSTNEGKPQYQCYQRGGEISNISVADYLEKSKSWRHLRKLYRVPVEFHNSVTLPIPPYILGLLLGDGSIVYGVEYTTADPELAEVFQEYVYSVGCGIRVSSNGSKALTYHAVKKKGLLNPIAKILRDLDLFGCCSLNKFIPKQYLSAPRKERLELLAGLCDTDGYYSGRVFEYSTKSKELAENILFLARSLGFLATIREKFSKCQTGASGWYYRIFISGELCDIPFRRKRHVPSKRMQKKNILRTGFSVELLPEDDFYGFELDGDHLYVDGNFFVHHNTGKSVVLGKIAGDAVKLWNGRVLILAHVKELLEQNANKVKSLYPDIPVGIYSAGLNSRDTSEPVLVAGIQSVYNKADQLGKFDIIIVDEAHLIAPEGDGMYRTFISDSKLINPNVRIIGLTATPFRMKGGLICQPENILNAVCYEAGLKEMIQQGYLSPLISKAGKAQADLGTLHVRGGEFLNAEIEAAMDRDEITTAACKEIVELTKDRKSVLIFTTSIAHCKHVCEAIETFSGMECAMISGDTPDEERAITLERFKGKSVPIDLLGTMSKPLKFLANVNVLTTGFDAPNVDCVVLLRPTASPGLLLQMIGRGTRLSPQTGKSNCQILDYGENILRHGPVDCIKVKDKTTGKGGNAPAKKCPQCLALIHAGYGACPDCGYIFPPPQATNMSHSASGEAILSGQAVYTDLDVGRVYYSVHRKKGADDSVPKTMRVDYEIGFQQYQSECVCPGHSGYARNKFLKWWKERAAEGCPIPKSAEEAVELAEQGLLAEPSQIRTKRIAGEKYSTIDKYILKDRPVMRQPGEDAEEYHSNSPQDLGVHKDIDWDDDIPF